jgi:hypothetical protein
MKGKGRTMATQVNQSTLAVRIGGDANSNFRLLARLRRSGALKAKKVGREMVYDAANVRRALALARQGKSVKRKAGAKTQKRQARTVSRRSTATARSRSRQAKAKA